jgi:hypothetical protein
MAKRKTKAEQVAEHEEFMARREAEEVAAFPGLLMAQLERATNSPNSFTLTVRDSKFLLVEGRDNWTLSPVHPMQAQIDLESLMWDLDQLDEDRRKAAEREAAKKEALAKLTDFERELLGL